MTSIIYETGDVSSFQGQSKYLTCFLVNGEVLGGKVRALALRECVPHVTELRAPVAVTSSDKPDLLSNGHVVPDLK